MASIASPFSGTKLTRSDYLKAVTLVFIIKFSSSVTYSIDLKSAQKLTTVLSHRQQNQERREHVVVVVHWLFSVILSVGGI